MCLHRGVHVNLPTFSSICALRWGVGAPSRCAREIGCLSVLTDARLYRGDIAFTPPYCAYGILLRHPYDFIFGSVAGQLRRSVSRLLARHRLFGTNLLRRTRITDAHRKVCDSNPIIDSPGF